MRDGILAAGNWIADRVKSVDRWPGEGNLCSILAEERAPGGGPANILFDLAAMDSSYPLYAAGRIGEDADGDFLLAEAAKRGIDTSLLRRTPGVATAYTDVISSPGSRTFFHAAGADAFLCAADFDGAEAEAEFFYLGYLLLLRSLDMPDAEFGTGAARLLAAMRKRGFRTVVDFVSGSPDRFRPAAEAAFRGNLVKLPDDARAVLDALHGGSPASYAIRFAAGFPGMLMVLSGMSTLEQVQDNISFMKDFKPLGETELAAIAKVQEIFRSKNLIPCTGCRYCTDGCPKQIAIPELFATMNAKQIHHDWHTDYYYNAVYALPGHKASDCVKCGKCESVCPQHLPIRQLLENVAKEFEKKEA